MFRGLMVLYAFRKQHINYNIWNIVYQQEEMQKKDWFEIVFVCDVEGSLIHSILQYFIAVCFEYILCWNNIHLKIEIVIA